MEYLIIILVLFIVGISTFLLFSMLNNKDNKKNKDNKNNRNNKNSTNSDSNHGNLKREDVFKFMEFDKIIDNMIVQNKGQRYTMAIKCKGTNYDLMSDVEQLSVEQGFITFLNTLKYPIQLYVQAQNIDLKNVINGYKNNIANLQEEYNKYNKKFEEKNGIFGIDQNELDSIVEERTKIQNVYEYANDIIAYVEKMSSNKSLLQRNFYVLVSYSKGEISAADKFSKEEIVDMCYTELLTRCNSIISALSSSSVSGRILDSNELAELLYVAYNRDDKSMMSVHEALESGFYRLYSTSEDAFQKRQKMLDEAIDTEARLKAIQSIQKAIEDGTYKTNSATELETEEEISKKASELIKAENLDPKLKQDSYDNVITDYREIKKEYTPKIEEEKENLKRELTEEENMLKEKYEDTELYMINEKKKKAETEHQEDIKREKEELEKIISENEGKEDKKDNNEDSLIV